MAEGLPVSEAPERVFVGSGGVEDIAEGFFLRIEESEEFVITGSCGEGAEDLFVHKEGIYY